MHFGWARRRVSLNSEPGTRGVETYAPVAMVESKPQNRQAQHGIEQGNLQEAASIHIRICICLSIWSLHNNGNTLSARRPSLHQDHCAHWLEGSSNVRRIPFLLSDAMPCHAMPLCPWSLHMGAENPKGLGFSWDIQMSWSFSRPGIANFPRSIL
jgi:hypothetical protein